MGFGAHEQSVGGACWRKTSRFTPPELRFEATRIADTAAVQRPTGIDTHCRTTGSVTPLTTKTVVPWY
ncbi:MAG: hypothetical protein IPH35_26525 [Rhodoferax sp.]|nr:hypothetical protein [Rhodoferax sp.]